MADLYTVKLQGTTDLTLERALVSWREVERVYRTQEDPRPLVRIVFGITISAVVRPSGSGETQSQLLTALSSAWANYLHKRAGPTYLKVLDATGTAVPQIGGIDLSDNAWDSLEITEIRIPNRDEDPGQFRGHVAFTMELRAEKVFPDSDGVCELDVVSEEGANSAGQRTRKRTTTLKIARSSSTTAADIASDHALAAPVGWYRVEPTGTSSGVSIEYLDGDRGKWIRFVSEVTEASGASVPRNSSDQGWEVEERDDPERGLLIRTTRAELQGDSAQSWVRGKQPEDAVGRFAYDRVEKRAEGEWEERSRLRPAQGQGKVTKNRWRRSLSGGGRRVSVAELAGNVKPRTRIGPLTSYQLAESVDVFALGAASLTDIPLPPPPPPTELWEEIRPLRIDGLPEVQDPGRTLAQHVGRRQATRVWAWLGNGDPLDNALFSKWVMNEFTVEETP